MEESYPLTVEKKLNEQYEYLSNLDENFKNDLISYTYGSYNSILNRYLIDPDNYTLGEDAKRLFETLKYCFEHIKPIEEPVVLYRGTNREDINESMYLSTSSDVNIAKEFTRKGCCLFIITVSSGCKVLPLKYMSASRIYSHEEEYLLNRGGYYIITNVTLDDNSMKNIHVTLLPEDSRPLNEKRSNMKCIVS